MGEIKFRLLKLYLIVILCGQFIFAFDLFDEYSSIAKGAIIFSTIPAFLFFNSSRKMFLLSTSLLLIASISIIFSGFLKPVPIFASLLRFVPYFLIISFFYVTKFEDKQINELAKLFFLIASIQFLFSIIVLSIPNLVSFKGIDSGLGTFGAEGTGPSGIYIAVAMLSLFILWKKVRYKVVLLIAMLVSFSIAHAGGAMINIIFLIIILGIIKNSFLEKRDYWKIVLMILVLPVVTHYALIFFASNEDKEIFKKYIPVSIHGIDHFTGNLLALLAIEKVNRGIPDVENISDLSEQGFDRKQSIINSIAHSKLRGNLVTGGGFGSVATGFIFGGTVVEQSYYMQVFHGISGSFVNGYSILIAEVGSLGIIIFLSFPVLLYVKKYKTIKSNRSVQLVLGLFMIFLILDMYYKKSFHNVTVLIPWAFFLFNIPRLLDNESNDDKIDVLDFKLYDFMIPRSTKREKS